MLVQCCTGEAGAWLSMIHGQVDHPSSIDSTVGPLTRQRDSAHDDQDSLVMSIDGGESAVSACVKSTGNCCGRREGTWQAGQRPRLSQGRKVRSP